MKTTSLLFIILLFSGFCFSQNTYVPDDNFEQALIDLGYDSGVLDDYVLTANINTITSLGVRDLNISDLTGIEDFLALADFDCSKNRLTNLSFTQNIALFYLVCDNNQLTSLDVSQNTALTTLICYSNQLTSLDVTNNTVLTTFSCGDNKLTSLDVSQNPALTILFCLANQLISLDVKSGNNTIMTSFFASNNPNLTCIKVDDATYSTSNWTNIDSQTSFSENCNPVNLTYVPDDNFEQALIDLGYDTGPLDDYVLTANIDTVTYLDVQGLNITNLTGIEDFIALTFLNCYNNQITSLDVTQNINLTDLFCSSNQISSLDVTQNLNLEKLSCGVNQLTSLDVTRNKNLTLLSFRFNQISNIDVTQNLDLETFECNGNLISNLNILNNPKLEYLNCGSNLLTTIDTSINTALKFLACNKNQITDLDLTLNILLEQFFCSNNLLTNIDITNNTRLTLLGLTNNYLTSLDVTQNPELTWLAFVNNQIVNIDLTRNTVLIDLAGSNNFLTSLDLTQNTLLELAVFEYNQLTYLDIRNGNNTNIEYFFTTDNLDLTCIFVDDANYSAINWLDIDVTSTFYETDEECDCIPPEIDELDDVNECGGYVLQALSNGKYYSETLGGGAQLNVGDNITTSQIIFIYAEDPLDSSCYNEDSFTVEIYPIIDFELTINNIEINDYNVEINMANGSINYEYAVDDTANYQISNLFFDLSEGSHILYVKDENSCIEKTVDFQIYSSDFIIPNFFTPNNDGENDYWEIIDVNNTIESINIHDRFGKIITTVTPNIQGWDGYYNGESMPSTDYWYAIRLFSGEIINGHFTLVR